jgi:large-conductance mechanosensitive channel
MQIDTVYIERLDSIQVPYPVEKQLTKWQQIKLDFSDTVLGVLLFVIVALVIYIIIRSRNKK